MWQSKTSKAITKALIFFCYHMQRQLWVSPRNKRIRRVFIDCERNDSTTKMVLSIIKDQAGVGIVNDCDLWPGSSIVVVRRKFIGDMYAVPYEGSGIDLMLPPCDPIINGTDTARISNWLIEWSKICQDN